MIEKTIPDIVAFILDPDAHTLNARVRDTYISLIKMPVGAATFVYGCYGYSADFTEALGLKYTLGSIAVSNTVYVVDCFNTFGCWSENLDGVQNVVTLANFVSTANECAWDIYRDWYAALPLDEASTDGNKELATHDMIVARSDFIQNGRNSNTFAEPSKDKDFIDADKAVKLLTRGLSLEDYILQQLEEDRKITVETKRVRSRLLELVRNGVDFSETTQAVADAIRDLDTKTLNVTFEHDGKVREYKLGKFGLQKCLMENYIYPYYDTFRTQKEGEEFSFAFTGRKYEHVLVSYISKIVVRGKTVYVRKDEA